MLPPTVKAVAADEKERVWDAVTLAFSDDPMMRWMMAEPHAYLANLRHLQGALAGRSFEHGGAFRLDDFSAAALWLPPGVEVDGEAMMSSMERVPEKLHADLGGVVEQMGAFHPHEPHWYLAVLGVDANRQGKGLGSILMKHVLARVDSDRMPAYLESSNARNIPFYERHGFEVLGRIQSGATPSITPMLRRAR